MNNKLLLTGTIDVGGCMNLSRRDFNVRLEDYKKTILKYLTTTDLNLIFVENSNQNCLNLFSEINKNYSDRLEFIPYNGNSNTNIYGKGSGEKDSILYALKHSIFLKNENFFYKVTGRYYSPDIINIIKNTDTSLYETVNRTKQDNQNILTVFFGSNIKKFIEYFNESIFITDYNIFEKVFSNFVDTIDKNKVYWLPEMKYVDTIVSDNSFFIKG